MTRSFSGQWEENEGDSSAHGLDFNVSLSFIYLLPASSNTGLDPTSELLPPVIGYTPTPSDHPESRIDHVRRFPLVPGSPSNSLQSCRSQWVELPEAANTSRLGDR